jgi:hypothetical protein
VFFFAPRKKTHPPGYRQATPTGMWHSVVLCNHNGPARVNNPSECPRRAGDVAKHGFRDGWVIMAVRPGVSSESTLRAGHSQVDLAPSLSDAFARGACLTRAHRWHSVVLCNHNDPARVRSPQVCASHALANSIEHLRQGVTLAHLTGWPVGCGVSRISRGISELS